VNIKILNFLKFINLLFLICQNACAQIIFGTPVIEWNGKNQASPEDVLNGAEVALRIKTFVDFMRSMKVMAELFAYRIVLNRIVCPGVAAPQAAPRSQRAWDSAGCLQV
jgi:hypothetical protein